MRRLPDGGGFDAKVWRNSGQGWFPQGNTVTGDKAKVEAWAGHKRDQLRRQGFSVEVRMVDAQGQMM